MKKQLGVLTLIAGLTILGTPQLNGQILPTEEDYYAPFDYDGPARDDSELFSYYLSIGGGACAPMGQWGAQADLSKPLLASFLGEDGMGATYGGYVSLRNMVNFSYEAINGWSTIGHWNLEYSSNGYPELHPDLESGSQIGSDQLSFGIGAGRAYNWNNRWGFAAELNMYFPTIQTFPSYDNHFPAQEENEFSLEPSEFDQAWYPGYGLSLAFRSQRWRISVEYFTIRQSAIYTYERIEQPTGQMIESDFTADFRVSTLRFGIDYMFTIL